MKAYDLTHLARRVALLILAAIGVHQLRYLAAYGSDSGAALSQQGHGYLDALLPDLIGAATVVMLATLAARLISGRARSTSARHRLPEWLLYASAIFAIFGCQELVEGALASNHPSGLAALTANGGWVAGPIALLFGTLVALAVRLLDRADGALETLTETASPRRNPAPPLNAARRLAVPLVQLALGFGFARRPPPLATRSV